MTQENPSIDPSSTSEKTKSSGLCCSPKKQSASVVPDSTNPKTMVAIPGYATTYEILSPGQGAAVAKGATVTVHATGVVQETGKKFWSTKDEGQQPFTYQAGVGRDRVGMFFRRFLERFLVWLWRILGWVFGLFKWWRWICIMFFKR